mgnify:CR=1 FL=1
MDDRTGVTGVFTIRGGVGILRSGCRDVATFACWEAGALAGHRRLRLSAKHFEPHPFWWRHHTLPLVCDLDVGARVWRSEQVRVLNDNPLELMLEAVQIV